MKEGLSDEVKKNLLQKYLRKGDLYTEHPKINLEVPKRRNQHFAETQRCRGSAILFLGVAVSLLPGFK